MTTAIDLGQILSCVGVPLRAMSLGGILRRLCISSHQILSAGHRFEVRWSHAPAVPAEVIELQTFWDRAK